MRVSIHQPNFFPHLPIFKKMAASHIFVILGHCQFEKNGFQNRFYHNGRLYTMSVPKKTELICEKTYIKPERDWLDIKRRLKDYEMDEFDYCISESLLNTNTAIIEHIAGMLKINVQIRHDFETEKTGTARLVDICKKYGAYEYIAGPSGPKYLDIEQFKRAGIKVEVQKKEHSRPIIDILRRV